jgi:hypothetical protein
MTLAWSLVGASVASWLVIGLLTYYRAGRSAQGLPDIKALGIVQCLLGLVPVMSGFGLGFVLFASGDALAGGAVMLAATFGTALSGSAGRHAAWLRHGKPSPAQSAQPPSREQRNRAHDTTTMAWVNLGMAGVATLMVIPGAATLYFLVPKAPGMTLMVVLLLSMPAMGLSATLILSSASSDKRPFVAGSTAIGVVGLPLMLLGLFVASKSGDVVDIRLWTFFAFMTAVSALTAAVQKWRTYSRGFARGSQGGTADPTAAAEQSLPADVTPPVM